MYWTLRLALLFLCFLLVGSCCVDPVDQTAYFCLGEMSLKEEVELGDAYAPNIDAMFDGVYHDPAAADYLGQLILEMAGHSVRAEDFAWKFTILNSSTPNAFAVPGGYIYITRGLLAALETEGQFISVMGHELGHVEHRHSHQAMGRNLIGGILVGLIGTAESAVTRNREPGLASSIGAAGAQLFLLRYDRGQELQSDKRGVYYAAAMGYDPAEATKTFAYFQRLEEESGGVQIEWLRTHPLNENRITDIHAEIAEKHPELAGRPQGSFRPYRQGNDSFAQIIQTLGRAEPTYEKYDAAWTALGKALEDGKKGPLEQALASFEECAAAIPDEPLFHTAIGACHLALESFAEARFEQGDYRRAAAEFELASDLFPMSPAPLYYYGLSCEKLGRSEEAVRAYRKVVELDQEGSLGAKARERLRSLGAARGR
ncbi:MAG: M48 family metalloprotease [Planctomycetes bacterium]|nr:M48 family metalloprotease [Planctomycetota bacterium]